MFKYTKCTECNAVFKVTEDQLTIADGLVRCGICDTVFNGVEYIQHDYEDQQSDDKDTEHKDASLREEHANETGETIPELIRDDVGKKFPSSSSNNIKTAIFTLGAIALVILLLGQITYWQKIELLPQNWIDNFCDITGCRTTSSGDASTIKILNRNIFSHPNVTNALMITVSFVNESDNAQPFPKLQITLLDTQGQVVATRQFTAQEYLINKTLAKSDIQPHQPVGARLEVFDPGSKVIAYEIEFF